MVKPDPSKGREFGRIGIVAQAELEPLRTRVGKEGVDGINVTGKALHGIRALELATVGNAVAEPVKLARRIDPREGKPRLSKSVRSV